MGGPDPNRRKRVSFDKGIPTLFGKVYEFASTLDADFSLEIRHLHDPRARFIYNSAENAHWPQADNKLEFPAGEEPNQAWRNRNKAQLQQTPSQRNQDQRCSPVQPRYYYDICPGQQGSFGVLGRLERNTHLFLMLRGVLPDGVHAPRRVDYIKQDEETIIAVTLQFERTYLLPLLVERLGQDGVTLDPGWTISEMCEALWIHKHQERCVEVK